MTTPTPAQADEKALRNEWRGILHDCCVPNRVCRFVEKLLAALRPEGEAVAPLGYMRQQDRDGNSFWCSRNKSAYYTAPVFANPPAPAGMKVKAARAAVEHLANVQMNISLEEWNELSSTILSALPPDPEAQAATQTPFAWVRIRSDGRKTFWEADVGDCKPLYLEAHAHTPAESGLHDQAHLDAAEDMLRPERERIAQLENVISGLNKQIDHQFDSHPTGGNGRLMDAVMGVYRAGAKVIRLCQHTAEEFAAQSAEMRLFKDEVFLSIDVPLARLGYSLRRTTHDPASTPAEALPAGVERENVIAEALAAIDALKNFVPANPKKRSRFDIYDLTRAFKAGIAMAREDIAALSSAPAQAAPAQAREER